MEQLVKNDRQMITELTAFADELMVREKDMEKAIDEFLVKMGALFDVDSIVIKEKVENGAAVKCTYQWSRRSDTLLRGLERRFVDKALEEWEERYQNSEGFYL